jgi:cell division protein FtsB
MVTAFFLSWIFFFAENDLVTQYKQGKEYNEMKEKIKYLEAEIQEMKKQTIALQTDSVAIEKYAREHYHMKKPNEEIFVFYFSNMVWLIRNHVLDLDICVKNTIE